MSVKDKWVRRFSVAETSKHEKGFTIYKITSVLFPIDSPEAVTVISVWKRYSDVQTLHKSMRSLHSGLHLRGTFPELPKWGYFKRFDDKVIQERAKTTKVLLEFVAEHKLLFTSTDFVNFLQTGYPAPKDLQPGGIIQEIRSSLHLPLEDAPVLDYRASDEDSSSPRRAITQDVVDGTCSINELIPQIPIYEAADVEIRSSPTHQNSSLTHQNSSLTHQNLSQTHQNLSLTHQNLSQTHQGSLDSLNSLESIGSDLYENISKTSIEKPKSQIKKNLPDLINFDEPSTSVNISNIDINRRQSTDSESISTVSIDDSKRSISRLSIYKSISDIDSKAKMENSYVFEAGYLLNLAARCEDIGEYQKAFDYYKSGIEKMLIGVKSDSDPQRRALIKEKTNKYLSYAEDIYRNHLSDADQSLLPPQNALSPLHLSPPISLLSRPYEDLSSYRVLAVLGSSLMLVLHRDLQTCRAMKVVQKIPNNLTEFDAHFLQTVDETKKPILPTNVPYMVPLQSFIETNNLIFLILSYAPGEKLLDYIKKYVESTPNTPARQNLENVFNEPLRNESDNTRNENDNYRNENKNDSDKNYNLTQKTEDLETLELVINSQKLLKNVDKALKLNKELRNVDDNERNRNENVIKPPLRLKINIRRRDVLPPSAICKWGAEILTALESLHNSGVVCRDLNPSNILLGDGGQIILTYFLGYSGLEMSLNTLTARVKPGDTDLYIAPEIYNNTILDESCMNSEINTDLLERCCDFWSFGAIMYELLCGVPLSHYHTSVFSSHTLLQLPEGLDFEVQSLLTQLLTYEPSERLGAKGIEEIKQHPYFKHIDWAAVYDGWIVPD